MQTLKEMVSGNKVVTFVHYREGALTYKTEDGFQFSVPVSDTGNATFQAEDKAILFMRWIRRAMEEEASWVR